LLLIFTARVLPVRVETFASVCIQLCRVSWQDFFLGVSAACLFHGAPIARARVHSFHLAARISVYLCIFPFILTHQNAYMQAAELAQNVLDGCLVSSFPVFIFSVRTYHPGRAHLLSRSCAFIGAAILFFPFPFGRFFAINSINIVRFCAYSLNLFIGY
jgi:hypothetical protein